MNIDKATQVLKLYAKGVPKHNRTDFEDALELSIDALKKIKSWRDLVPNPNATLLKGETTD